MQAPLRVAVSSPELVVRRGLEVLLRSHPTEVHVVDDDDTHEPDCDVVIYDALHLVAGDETQLRTILLSRTTVLVMDRGLRPGLAAHAARVGAHGFFSSGIDEAGLMQAVLSAGSGWQIGDPGTDPPVGSRHTAEGSAQLGSALGLSARELDILSLITNGQSNREIAAELYLSINSVKTYIRSAYRRIGVTRRSQAVGWGMRHGFDHRTLS